MSPVGRRFTSVLAAALLVLTSTTASYGVTPTDDADFALQVGVAVNFRSTFGYSTEIDLIKALESDADADRKYSVALTADEVADMDRRMAIQAAMEPLIEYAHLSPDTFGGVHIDQAAGGVYYFSFTSGISAQRTVLDAMAPAGADIRYRTVERTEADLDELVFRASRELAFNKSLSIAVLDVATSIARNSVDVFVAPFSDDTAKALQERYGDWIRVLPGRAPEITACSNRDNCDGPPIMAGVSNDWGCTVGFGVHGSSVSTNRRFLTAGHCVYQVVSAYGWGGWTWFHHNTNLGLSTAHSWYDYSTADAGTMGNVSSTKHSRRVMFNATPSWYTTSSKQGASGDAENDAICQSGQTSGFQCGTILSLNSTPCYDNTPGTCSGSDAVHMAKQRKANYFVQVGDSGAPVVSMGNRNKAVGLQSGRDGPNIAYYSHIGHVQAELGQYVRITD